MTLRLAFETIHYAVEALMFDRKLALDVIKEEDNGLSPEQKAAICQKIQELQDRPRTVKEKNRLENRLIGVLQPATLRFLEEPEAISGIFKFLPANDAESAARVFGIQTSTASVLFKQELRKKTCLMTHEIHQMLETLYGKQNSAVWNAKQIQELLELAPEFYELAMYEGPAYDSFPDQFLLAIAEAIRNCGEKTKFRKISGIVTTRNLRLYQQFPKFSEFKILEYGPRVDCIHRLLSLPNVEIIEAWIYPMTLDELQINENRLKGLKFKISYLVEKSFSTEQIEKLKKLPIIELDFSDAEVYIEDHNLQEIAKLPQLKTINISDCHRISISGLQSFIRNSNIETVILKPCAGNNRFNQEVKLTHEQTYALQVEFPQVKFTSESVKFMRDL